MIKKYSQYINESKSDLGRELINASEKGDLLKVKELIKAGVDINIKDKFSNNALIYASDKNYLEIVKLLIKVGADLNLKSKEGDTALIIATYCGYVEIIKELIKAGADLFIKNIDGKTFMDYYDRCPGLKTSEFQDWLCSLDKINFLVIPKEILHPEIEKKYKSLSNVDQLGLFESKSEDLGKELIEATYNCDLEKVKELIKAGADVNIKDKNCYSALVIASRKGDLEIVKEIIKSGADLNIKDDNGNTALIGASCYDNLEIVKELIKSGADVNIKNNIGVCASIVASFNGCFDIVKELIKAGADLFIKDYDGKTFMDYSKDCKGLKSFEFQDWLCSLDKINFLLIPKEILHPKIEQKYKGLSNIEELGLFESKSDLGRELINASEKGDLEKVKELIKAGADINYKNSIGYTPLIAASDDNHLEIVKELIKSGANLNIKNIFSNTALIKAIYKDHLKIVKELIKAGADLNLNNMNYYENCPGLKTFEFQDWLCSLDKINFLLIPKEILHPDIKKKYKSLSNTDDLGLF